jgi:nucleoprotein TPR
LNTANSKLNQQLVEMETQAKLGDSEVVPLRYQVQRLHKEVDNISTHSQWVQGELSAKNEHLASLKASQASELAQLRADFDSAVMEKESVNSELVTLRRRNEQLDCKVEHLAKDLYSTRQEASATTMAMEHELVAERRLVSLQKESLERLQQRHDAVVQDMDDLQALANEAQHDSRQEVAQIQQQMQAETKQIVEDQAAEYKQRLEELKKQLEESDRRRVVAEDGLLLTNVPASRRRTPARPALRDRAEATDEPLNLTDLYTRLAETEDQLQTEFTRRKRAEILLDRTKAEIEAAAPTLVRQRQEYELALERSEEYKKRMNGALQEAQAYRNETSELQLELSRSLKHNKELDQETVELAKQVQALLLSRSGGEVESNMPISVEEIQTQNQHLLREHRRLTTTITDLEQKVEQDPTRNKLASKEKEVEVLNEDRQRQMVLVESIVQQRDLYRTLVSKHDSNILGSPSEEATALTIVKQQSERTKTLECRNDQLENDLHAARGELGAIAREKEATSERLARYEALTTDLTSSVDRLQLQVSSAKADVARSEADASFHKEKSARLEEALQRSRDEVVRATSSKNELQRITADLQKAISVANGQASKSESELKQAEMRLRLAETQAETAKAAERRITEEANQLRNDVARQGALLDSVQRIEASLSARTATEQESLNEQVIRLRQQISEDKTKHSTEVESLSGKIQGQETRVKELELSSLKATKEALEAKRESLKASTEVQALEKKCDTLESQLRTAKRKLGESGDEEDVEAQLQNMINGLETQLGTAKTEIATLKERNATYQKLAKDSENALAELVEATKEAKEVHEKEIADLKSHSERTRTESTKRQEVITELTNDLAAHRGEQDKVVAELNRQMSTLKSETDSFQKDAESTTSRFATLETEVVSLRAEVSSAQVSRISLFFLVLTSYILFLTIFLLCRTTTSANYPCILLQGLLFVRLKRRPNQQFVYERLRKSSLQISRANILSKGVSGKRRRHHLRAR